MAMQQQVGEGQKLAMGSPFAMWSYMPGYFQAACEWSLSPWKLACVLSNSDLGWAANGAEGSTQAKWIWEQNKALSSSWKVLGMSGRVENSLHYTVLSPALQSISEHVFYMQVLT